MSHEQSTRIVVVDDEKLLAWSMGMLLTKAGYKVSTFTNSQMALREVQQGEVDLVISDVIMPGLSGIDLAIELKEKCPLCQIILLSGQANTVHLLASARSQGFDFEVFPKPISPDNLLDLVKRRVC